MRAIESKQPEPWKLLSSWHSEKEPWVAQEMPGKAHIIREHSVGQESKVP